MKSPISKNFGNVACLLVILIGSIASAVFGLKSSAVISFSGSIYYPPEARVLFEDEFESSDFSNWDGIYTSVGDNATVASINPYEKFYHGRFQTDGTVSGWKHAYCYKVLSPEVSEVYARGYFYIVDRLPLNDNGRFGLIDFEVGSHTQCTFRVLRSGGVDKFNVIGYNGSSTVTQSTDVVYPVERRWYCMEFYIKVHGTGGEYRVWIDGVEIITVTSLDTTFYGTGVSRVLFGLTYTADVQHDVEVYCDCVVISTRYVGAHSGKYTFGVIGSVEENLAIRNFYWLFGNQSISYNALLPSEVTNFVDVDRFDGLVVWTKHRYGYDATAIRQFAETHIVISNTRDFCNVLYPSLGSSTEVVSANTVTYVMDWGNFRVGDLAEMRNETGNVDQFTTVLASGLANFTNITTIARYDTNRIAFFHMNGTQSKSGFYVMDLDVTSPDTEVAGIWHIFPAVKMVKDFPTGRFARWMSDGKRQWKLPSIHDWMTNFTSANSDIVRMVSIGKSVLDRDIDALFIGNGNRYAIVDGCLHGNERTTTFASLRLAEVIVEGYRGNGYWYYRLKELTVIIIPVLNPDGYVNGWRGNANQVNLNRNFPPKGNASEPETRALINLMGNYTPIIYINNHEGAWYDPNEYWYGQYENEPYTSFTISALRWANITFTKLHHWGWYTDGGLKVWLGTVRQIARSGLVNSAQAYACWKHQACTLLVESIVWSGTYGARQSLWGLDYYVCASIAFLMHLDKLSDDKFILHSTAKIVSAAYDGHFRVELDSSELTSLSLSKIHVGGRGKPLAIKIDGVEKTEGDGWIYDTDVLTVTGAKNIIEISW